MNQITLAELEAKYPTPAPSARDQRIIDTAYRLVHLYLGPDIGPDPDFHAYIMRQCKNRKLSKADTRAVYLLAHDINFR